MITFIVILTSQTIINVDLTVLSLETIRTLAHIGID